MSAAFKDHFSDTSDRYARYRPSYPPALFAWLASTSPQTERAWDVGTGSGQAARALGEHFTEVVATDASERQLERAEDHARVRYACAPAEHSGLADASVDLITVAQAAHWFDLPAFYAEVRRVARGPAVLALWCYSLLSIDQVVDPVLQRFHLDTMGPWWPPERALTDSGYVTIPFPFDELTAPACSMVAQWDLADLLGYLGTWSSVRAYRQARGDDPLQPLGADLAAAWGDPQARRDVRWPVHMRVGRVESGGGESGA